MPIPEANVLVIVSYGSSAVCDADEANALARTLSEQLNIPVLPAFLDAAVPSVGESIQEAVVDHRPEQVIVLPLFVGASAAKKHNLRLIVDAAAERWSKVVVHDAEAPGTHPGAVAAYLHLLQTAAEETDTDDTALLVVGRGSRDPESCAEVRQMALAIGEKVSFASVDVAYCGAAQPDIPGAIRQRIQSGARRIMILPYLLYEKSLYEMVQAQVRQSQALYPDVPITLAPHLDLHPGIFDAITQRYQEALAELTAPRRVPSHSHGAGNSHSHASISNLDAILPPRYHEGAAVSAEPMGAADLIFDVDGQVAWDQIWDSFCDLALAGGPPHRGTLLEPASPDAVQADPLRYQQVLAELERGIRMVTHLPVVACPSPGWIGIQCDDVAMALWLLRAIIVENVSVRREDTVLYLPAGPHYRLEHEIKNVITVVAKTYHYWKEHLNGPYWRTSRE